MFFGTEAKIPEIKFAILDLTSLLLLPLPLQLRQPRRVLGLRAGGGVGLTAASAALAGKRERHFEARSRSVSLLLKGMVSAVQRKVRTLSLTETSTLSLTGFPSQLRVLFRATPQRKTRNLALP